MVSAAGEVKPSTAAMKATLWKERITEYVRDQPHGQTQYQFVKVSVVDHLDTSSKFKYALSILVWVRELVPTIRVACASSAWEL